MRLTVRSSFLKLNRFELNSNKLQHTVSTYYPIKNYVISYPIYQKMKKYMIRFQTTYNTKIRD